MLPYVFEKAQRGEPKSMLDDPDLGIVSPDGKVIGVMFKGSYSV